MNGKNKCKILKSIRKKIAEDNGIAYVTTECKYKGDCSGTCPKCEAELRDLEKELAKRKNLGKSVAVAGIAAALVVASTGCDVKIPNETAGTPLPQETTSQTQVTELIPGEVPIDETTEPTTEEFVELAGEPVLMGDIPAPEESTWWD